MKHFEFRRLGRVLAHDIQENRTKNLRDFAWLYVANFLVIASFFYSPSREGLDAMPAGLAEDILFSRTNAAVLICFSLLSYYAVSRVFSNFRTKQLRIANLMLPGTNLEKYLSRVLQYTVFYVVAFFAAFVLADLTRMLVFPVFGHSFPSLVPNMVEGIGSIVSGWHSINNQGTFPRVSAGEIMLLSVMANVWSYSCMLLGSAFFRKRAFLYTLLTGLGISIAMGVLCDLFLEHVHFSLEISLSWISAVFGVLACVNVWLSYLLFTRMQVIPYKYLRK